MGVTVSHLRKSYDGTPVIRDLSIKFPEKAISVLLGASGCGKTTTLRCIAGLETPDSGEILVNESVAFDSSRRIDVAPERRDIGMVFQSYAVWPHMTVFQNVAVPLRARKIDAATIRRRVALALDAVGLSSFADRSATKLSGGQQQRLALARCIVAESTVILLDEPLSNLDARLRVQMRSELRNLQRTFATTMVLVTHDQEEAMSIADSVYLLDAGGLVQAGPPADLYLRPVNRFCAEFFGVVNIFPITEAKMTLNAMAVTTPQGIDLSAKAFTPLQSGANVVAVVRPEAWTVSLRADEPPACWFPGEVRDTLFLGSRTEAVLETPLGPLNVVTKGAAALARGARVSINRDVEYMHFIPADMAAKALAP